MLSLGYHTTILGDFNLRDIDWRADPPQAAGVSAELVNLAALWDMEQIVPEPTRGTSFLDIILTTSPEAYKHCSTQPPVSRSDHSLVICKLAAPRRYSQESAEHRSNVHKMAAPNFTLANYDEIARKLSSIDWSALLSRSLYVNDMWNAFSDAILTVIKDNVPLKLSRSMYAKQRHRALFLRKKRRWRKWKCKPTQRNKDAYLKAAKHLSAAIKRHRATEEAGLLRKTPKAFFRYVSSQCHHRDQQIVLRNTDGHVMSDGGSICNSFAQEFTKNFSPARNISISIDSAENSAFQLSISLRSVLEVLMLLPESAAGPDGIPSLFYKRLAGALAKPLCTIFNQSLMQGCVPEAWKLAKVIPLYKGKGSKDAPSSYRPISLINVACKIMERIVVNSLNTYLESKDLLTACQHGFRHGRSTVTNVLSCDSFVWQCLNAGHNCDVISVDFMRAFDKVDHNLMCHKLKEFGVDGCYLRWFLDFLSNRWQYVEYNNAQSTLVRVTSGLVQGSCIGPTGFNIFINDLAKVIKHCKLFMFADDLKAAGDSTTPQSASLVQEDLDAIGVWSVENKLPVNLPKCFVMHYGKNNARQGYTLQSHQLANVNECTDLGILRSDTFTYSHQVKAVALKASRMVGMVMKIFSTRDATFLTKVFCAYIRPLLEYASPVWSPVDVTSCVLLENVQRKFTKRIAGLSSLSYEERLRRLKLPSLQLRRQHCDLLLAFKCLHSPSISPDDVGLAVQHSATRSSGSLVHKRPRSTLLAEHFICRVPIAWGKLPRALTQSSSIFSFKKPCQNCITNF